MDMTDRELQQREAAIARKYLGRVPWEMVVWGLGNVAVWLTLWPLVLTGTIPIWVGFLLSTACITLSYLPSHEAQHSIIAGEGQPLRWLNQLVGHVSTIPLVLGYGLLWETHKRHHAHANDPALDPDHYNKADTWWRSVWNGIQTRQPGSDNPYRSIAQQTDDPLIRGAVLESVALNTAHFVILAVFAWSGFAIEVFFLWWLPRHLATSYIALFLSWAPHYPMEEKGRYRDTRAWKSPVGTILSLGMEYHLVHHLYPKIPLFQTGPAFYEMREILEQRGIRNDGL